MKSITLKNNIGITMLKVKKTKNGVEITFLDSLKDLGYEVLVVMSNNSRIKNILK